MIRVRIVWLVPLLLAGALQANFSLPHVLSDGMVLQRDKPVRIWGKGKEGAEIKAWLNGQDGKTKVLVMKDNRTRMTPLLSCPATQPVQ